MDKKTLAALLQAGASGTNPYQEAQAQGAEQQKLAQLKDALSGQRLQKNLETGDQYIADNAAKGRKVSLGITPEGGVSVSQADQDYMQRMNGQLSRDAGTLEKLNKEHLKGSTGQLDTVNIINQLLDNPTQLNDINLQTRLARLYEGDGQRLLQSVIQKAGGKPDLIRSGADAVNFLLGTAKSGLSADKVNAIREEALQMGDVAKQNYLAGKERFNTVGRASTPGFAMSGNQDSVINSYTNRGDSLVGEFDKRKDGYMKTAGKNTQLGNPPPMHQPGIMEKLGLESLFGSKPTAPPPPPSSDEAEYIARKNGTWKGN